MKKFYIIFIALLMISGATAQSCLPEGITFTTQAQIDSFQTNYPGCTEIDGNVVIHGGYNITNLNGLNVLTSIGGDLELDYNYVLISLTGLNNLTSIGGYLAIGGTSLTSLTGLEGLTSIGGDLIISNAWLTSLMGLDNVTSVGEYLYIEGNPALTSLTGLENLTSIGDLFIYNNDALTSLTGLDNIGAGSVNDLYVIGNNSLSTCDAQWLCDYLSNPSGSINIYDNAIGCNNPIEVANSCGITLQCLPFGNYYFHTQAEIENFQSNYPDCTALQGNVTICGSDITNLTGLNNVTSIGGDLEISGNDSLTSLTGLDNLTSIGGNLEIDDNNALTILTGLDNLTSIGGILWIGTNPILTSLTGLDNITIIEGDLTICYNAELANLSGLNSLVSIGGTLQIYGNAVLSSLDGLESLTHVGGLSIGITGHTTPVGNPALVSLLGFINLTSVGGGLSIIDNDLLGSLSGLDNIDAGSITCLYIRYNYYLSICAIQSICDYLVSPNGTVEIYYNATGCNSQEEVDSACVYLSNGEVNLEPAFSIYPNPTSTQITIELPTTPIKNTTLTIYNISGQQINQRQMTEQQTVVDVSGLVSGVYFVRVTDDRTVFCNKFIKSNK